jgi:hypothetical protein
MLIFLDYKHEVCYKSVQQFCVLERVRDGVTVRVNVNVKFTSREMAEVSLLRIENGWLPNEMGKTTIDGMLFRALS